MFDLEKQMIAWRDEMKRAGISRPELLDELECHLRDEVAEQIRRGAEPAEAFALAAQSIGRAGALRKEFQKINSFHRFFRRSAHHAFRLAGVPHHYMDRFMNDSSLNPETRWATYARSATFAAPAIILWLLAAIYIMPQLNIVWIKSDVSNAAPARVTEGLVNLYRFNFHLVLFVKDHLFIILGALIVALALLEWRSKIWPRMRRVTFGTGLFLLNLAALLSLFVMFIAATFAATILMQHVK